MNYHIFDTAQLAVKHIADELKAYSLQGKPIHISLSGGSTPKLLFQTLAQAPYNTEIQWQNLHFWWGDERMVAPTDPESNYGEVQKLLFDHIAIPEQNIHRIRGEATPELELVRFKEELIELVPNQVFDWIILGMGTDGHTASLFPNQTDFTSQELAVLVQHPESGQLRISKTAGLIEKAKRVTYLVTGGSKAKVLAEIQANDPNDLPYPAARIVSNTGTTEWYLDKAAANELT